MGVEQDCLQNGRIGERARALAGRLGGREAEPLPHLQAACEANGPLWFTNSVRPVREPATELILERLIRERDDWRRLLGVVEGLASNIPACRNTFAGGREVTSCQGYCCDREGSSSAIGKASAEIQGQ